MAMGWLGWKVGEPSPSGILSREAPDRPEDGRLAGWTAVPPAAQHSSTSPPAGLAGVEIELAALVLPAERGMLSRHKCARYPFPERPSAGFSRYSDSACSPTQQSCSVMCLAECPGRPDCQGCCVLPLQMGQQWCVTTVAGDHPLRCLPEGHGLATTRDSRAPWQA